MDIHLEFGEILLYYLWFILILYGMDGNIYPQNITTFVLFLILFP